MVSLHEGQCGLGSHFGETHKPMDKKLIQIHSSKTAPEYLLDDCGHPRHVAAAPEGYADERLRRICSGCGGTTQLQTKKTRRRRCSAFFIGK